MTICDRRHSPNHGAGSETLPEADRGGQIWRYEYSTLSPLEYLSADVDDLWPCRSEPIGATTLDRIKLLENRRRVLLATCAGWAVFAIAIGCVAFG